MLSDVDVAPAAAEAKLEVREFGMSNMRKQMVDEDAIGEMEVFLAEWYNIAHYLVQVMMPAWVKE